jgi:translation initiation factor 4G
MQAAKEKSASEKDAYQRQLSMSRGGSRRGIERENPAGDGWAVAGPPGPVRQPTKAGDLSKFGQFIKPAPPANLAPTSVFAAGKKDNKRETASLSRTNSSQNMFSMLSQGGENMVEPLLSKGSRSPSRKASVDLTQSGVPDGLPQRKKLHLLPRSVPAVEEPAPAPASQATSEDETGLEDEALKRIREDVKEFFVVRSLEEAEIYFTNLAPEHRFHLIEKLVSSALESKESDAELVDNFFSVAVTKNLCSPDAFEKGFTLAAEILDDVAIDAPKAFDLMAIMVRGAKLDSERRERIARKLLNPPKLLDLLS